jgi:CubicO group peptidase (beta-lactamase class C family)
MSSERLGRLTAAVGEEIASRRLAGAVTLVLRDGKVVLFDAQGHADRERNLVMSPASLFRMASMTKAVTSVAAMMLLEEGRFTLATPVSRFIPEFRESRVARDTVDAAGLRTVAILPARRQITIRDLLTHTAGMSYGTEPRLDSLYRAADLYLWYFADKPEPVCASMERLATLPFAAHPGEAWVYGHATDALGCVIERASGMPLDAFLRTRIFEPLGMTDTWFFVPPEQAGRLAVVYGVDGDSLVRAPDAGRGQGAYVDGPRMNFSGGAGLVSTALDYARFLQLLLNGGELDGRRLLAPTTVDLMVSNHVGGLFQEGRFGFGLGFQVTEHVGRSGTPGSVGVYEWGGAYFTRFWVDPAERLVVVFLGQLLPAGGSDWMTRLRALVYQAVTRRHAP